MDTQIDTIIGFDSAWSGIYKGGISAVKIHDKTLVEFIAPELVSYEEALAFIRKHMSPSGFNLIAIDQPTVVENMAGGRPVDYLIKKILDYLGGGLILANRESTFFNDNAPIWWFLSTLNSWGFIQKPEESRDCKAGNYVIEVFPALSLLSFEGAQKRSLKYNPKKKNFKSDDWNSVIQIIINESTKHQLSPIAKYCESLRNLKFQTEQEGKKIQDKIDSILCLITAIASRWNSEGTVIVGDTQTGYMVTPCSEYIFSQLLRGQKIFRERDGISVNLSRKQNNGNAE
ncbi:MAG: DUF429 domain-containing protein [Alphaproteobacteria bacterium]|nr:DUF429 domain-containing protein [Alphaproteobacteria bacterium]